MPFQSSLSLYQCTLLPICTVATAVKAMCHYCSTFTVCDSNPHCHYIGAHCYQYVRYHSCHSHVPVLQYSYCMRFKSSVSLYQCTLLPIYTVATSVKTMCQNCNTITVYHSNPHCHYISALCYQYVRQPQLSMPCTCTAGELLHTTRILIQYSILFAPISLNFLSRILFIP